ncbi:Putative glutathione S-transferase, Thioredoxin-like superfamily [Septoria linicola]|uniref:Glutathione S-transferase, Thioredoxin-like superfamily n=1 Tax=Septoria linicola TaxID=215465 RepID=A0A9Q9AFW3_9PEZI|nr:Putative glutathione S-transferase, Thioredoxin-like superfamily [Septoria linicola]
MAYNPFQKPATTILNQDCRLAAPSPAAPWLLYAWPWAPYPRRVIIYLREKGITEDLVKVVLVEGDNVVTPNCPPRPAGSLPVLAIPARSEGFRTKPASYVHIRQSIAIINFLEELCNNHQMGFLPGKSSLRGTDTARNSDPARDALDRARISEVLSLADELMTAWNPVRTFGGGAGTILLPEAAKEMLRWVRRSMAAVETYFQNRDLTQLHDDTHGHVSISDIVLYQFFEFVHDCYGVDLTIGSGELVKDVYGREVKDDYPKLVEFYQVFKTRYSAKRVAEKGEVPPEWALAKMQDWADGVW